MERDFNAVAPDSLSIASDAHNLNLMCQLIRHAAGMERVGVRLFRIIRQHIEDFIPGYAEII